MNSKSFYYRPDVYDLIHNDKFESALIKHYSLIFSDKDIKSILDCSFGTGNLTFVLKKFGYSISGSDISEEMLKRAKEKADDFNIGIELFQSDFRNLTDCWNKKFDCVMATGNSLAHVNNGDVKKVLHEMSQLIRKGGYLYFDSRNWDLILKRKQRFYYYKPFHKDEYRINVMQVWDYNEQDSITFNFLYSYEKDEIIKERQEYIEIYYPFSRELILKELEQLGFVNIETFNFLNSKITDYDAMEWYCIIAQKTD